MTSADHFVASLGLMAYRVGGSVRDELLGHEAHDHDYIIRGATFEEIERAIIGVLPEATMQRLRLRDGREVGIRVHVPHIGALELVLPRTEISTGPGHRDFTIACDPNISLADDATRRDFTINALYRDVHTGTIHDPLEKGLDDLDQARICTTHPDSFRDDPLRILRALRFTSQLAFISPQTYSEMTERASSVTALTLKGVSATALSELEKLLMGINPAEALRVMRETGVLDVLLPELASMHKFEQQSAYHNKNLDDHVFDAIQAAAELNARLRVRMSLLFHDAGKPWMAWPDADGHLHYYALTPHMVRATGAPPTAIHSHEWWGAHLAGEALNRLNAQGTLRHDVTTLIERHMLPLHGKVRRIKVAEWRAEIGDELLRDLILHRRCDVLAKGGDNTSALQALDSLEAIQNELIMDSVPRSTTELAINGTDIIDNTSARLQHIGLVQEKLLHEVMAQPKLNKPEWLIPRAHKLAKELAN